MSNRSSFLQAILALVLLTCGALSAHGGAYRSPQPVVKVPGARTAPRAGGGVVPPPTTPGTQNGAIIPYDGSWFVWWEYNKARYISANRLSAQESLQSGVAQKKGHRAALGRDYVEKKLIPLFRQILKKGSSNRELVTGCLISLARLKPGEEAVPIFVRHLRQNQEVSETAVLALGISGSKAALPYLMSLALNEPKAANWVRGARVGWRARSFALFGLGIWCEQAGDNYARVKALAAAIKILDKESRSRRRNLRKDVEVAALQSIRLICTGCSGTSGDLLRKDATEFLLSYIEDKQKDDPLLRSHAVNALGGAIGRNPDPTGMAQMVLRKFMDDRKTHPWIRQSAAISLGQIGLPEDKELMDFLETSLAGRNDGRGGVLTGFAIAQIASDRAREILIQNYQRRSSEWIALALAVLDRTRRTRSGNEQVDKTIGEVLMPGPKRRLAANERDAGLAIAIGIQGYRPSALAIASGLDFKNLNFYNGYLAESLGLLGEEDSRGLLQRLIKKAVRHPIILSKAALALGQFEDPTVGPMLAKRLRMSRHTIEQASFALALGSVGREAEADQLIKVVRNRSEANLVRGFAAVGLGIMGDPGKLPWHYTLSSGINYLAQTPVLVGDGMGILEIF